MGETLFSPILKRGGLKVADEINSSYSVIMKNITKTFPGVVALANVNFELEEGEVKGLVGENGAGKSTLIKILTGAYTPDQGEIIIFGEKFGALNPIIAEKKRNCGGLPRFNVS